MARRNTEGTDIRPFSKFEVTDPALNEAVTTDILDTYSLVIITTTTTGNAQTLASPTNATNSTRITIANNDTSTDSISINGVDLAVGTNIEFVWDGTAWTSGGGTGAGGDFLADGSVPMTGAINETKGANIASATTTDIGAATGNSPIITGTTTITGFGTIQAGVRRTLTFSGILTLTYNVTSLILPSGVDIITAVGDTCDMFSLGGGNWVCTNYQRADGTALVSAGGGGSISEEFLVSYSGNQNMTSSLVQIIYNQEIYDVGNNFTSNKYTIPSTGTYEFNLCYWINGVATGVDQVRVAIRKNSSGSLDQFYVPDGNSGGNVSVNYKYIGQFTIGDVIDTLVLNNQNRGSLIGTSTRFSGHKIN